MFRFVIPLVAFALPLTAQGPSNYDKIGFKGRPQNATAQAEERAPNSLVAGAFTLKGYTTSEPIIGNLPKVGSKLQFKLSWHRFDEVFVTYNLTGAAFYTLSPTLNGTVGIPNAFKGRDLMFGNPIEMFAYDYWGRVSGELWWETGSTPPYITSYRSEMRDEVPMPNVPALAGMSISYQPFVYSFTDSKWVCGDETIFVIAP